MCGMREKRREWEKGRQREGRGDGRKEEKEGEGRKNKGQEGIKKGWKKMGEEE